MLRLGFLVVLAAALGGGGCANDSTTTESATPACASCKVAKERHQWCSTCSVGYVAGVKVPSFALFETLDAHGHNVDPDALPCANCREAVKNDGYCPRCKMGYVGGEAYLSRLTYYLVGRGTVGRREELDCAACQRHYGTVGWCAECERGWVGNVGLKDAKEFAAAQEEFALLHRAIAAAARCETCATAIFTGGRCVRCGISYRGS